MAWLPGYAYRKPLVLTGGASGAQTDFQLNIDIAHVAAKMQADFDDIRFTQNNGTTLIDAWLESKVDSTSAETWVEFPTTPANTVEADYYMYYGNGSAVSDWDIGATFVLGDDFNDASIDTSIWTVIGSPSESGGTLTTTSTSDYVKSIQTFGQNYALRSRSYFHATDASTLAFRDGAGSQTALEWVSNYPSANDMRAYQNNGSWVHSVDVANPAVWAIYDVIRNGSTSGIYNIDDVNKAILTTQLPSASLPVTGYSHIVMDWIVVRKYAANPPTYAFGAEESAPTGASPMGVLTGCFGRPFGGII